MAQQLEEAVEKLLVTPDYLHQEKRSALMEQIRKDLANVLSDQRGNVEDPVYVSFAQAARTAMQLYEQNGELCQPREDAQISGNCDKADKKELDSPFLKGADLICPDCDKPLMVTGSAVVVQAVGLGKSRAVAGAGLLLVCWSVARSYLAANRSRPTTPTPPPACSDSEISSSALHGSNTIGSRLAPELAKAFLEGKGANRIEQVPGGKELESFIQGDLNGDTVPEAIEIHAHGSRTALRV